MAQPSGYAGLLADAPRSARLRSWIVAVGVLVLGAFAGSSAYDSWRSYHDVTAATQRDLANLAKALAEQAEVSLQLVDLLLRDTAAWYENTGPKPGIATDSILSRRATGLPQVRVVSILDATGTQRYSSNALAGPVDEDLSNRQYFVAHRDVPRLGVFLSEPLVTQRENRPAIIMSRRLEKANGTFDGVVRATIDLQEFQGLYGAIDLGPGSAMNLLRDDGTLIVRQPKADSAMGARFPELVAPPSSGVVHSRIDDKTRFVAVAQVANFPLVVAVTRERDVALDGWRDDAYHVAVRTIVLMLAGACAIAALVYQLRRLEIGERALRQSEERYALAMEGANEGHFDLNAEAGLTFVSPQMKRLHGIDADVPIDSRETWLARLDIHPDDRSAMEAAFRDHPGGGSDSYEAEYRVRHSDGQWHWVQARGRCVRDDAGKVHRFVGSAIDITGRKNAEAEKERLATQLRQSQKMEAVGTLAGGIAHDFNNILGAILGYGELAQKEAGEGTAMRRYVDNVMHAGGRAKALVERILAFSRSGVGERRRVNVQAVVEETLEMLSASLPRDVRLVRKLEAGDAAIMGDATQLHQVVMNLCTNAFHAMHSGGTLEVALDRVQLAGQRTLSQGTIDAGDYVRLCVSDTGSGIPAAVLDRMFDPFFTTKPVGGGTGLGLSLVHGIVYDLGGTIHVRTAAGRGTTFEIWLPSAGEAAAPPPEATSELPRGDGQIVMVVDDELALVALTEEMLAGLGFEPIGFSSSAQALDAFRATPGRFDIVLSDETMPEMVGTDLARALLQIRPDLPIILMSGYSGAQVFARAREAGIREVLRKPLQIRELAQSFGRVLRSAERRKLLHS